MKVPFEVVDIEIDKIFSSELDPDDPFAVDKQIKLVRELVEACGWDEEEYIARMFEFNESN